MGKKENEYIETGLEIAVIGMAGRFPGANNIDEFWNNLKNGVESITFFSDKELIEAGVDVGLLNNPNYVKAGGRLDSKEYFDSSFFGYSPREAEIMDPQLRIFHECAWHALENAGYDTSSYDGSVGVYVGAMNSFDWQALSVLSGKGNELGGLAKALLHNRDLIGPRISHRLNLRGPSFTLFTACSTSLVAIHLGCRALLTGECSMAMAGGVSIWAHKEYGYLYQDGMILSPDGHCRAFDAQAKGTVYGEGIGVVVLKRAAESIADRDNIWAIIKGSAINNDGMTKVDFTAPSVKGQVYVINTAMRLSKVSPESIGYVETHGTGTKLGDPIEFSALIKAFNSDKRTFCAIGSVKTNVGHLDAASGVAGFIKTTMALKYRFIPPSLHFRKSDPDIDFGDSPFYVNSERRVWEHGTNPLRAGVSAFGIGGTNAHIIIEEPPEINRRYEEKSPSRDFQLIQLSAKSKSTLDKMTKNLAEYLKKNPEISLADTAYTLKVGRKAFQYRRIMVCSDIHEAISLLNTLDARKILTFHAKSEGNPVVFMFSGLGSQYVSMGKDLYLSEPLFREEIDRCCDILSRLTDYNIKAILYADRDIDYANKMLDHPQVSQLVILIFEYALTKLLMSWGIKPHVMIGYSFGEYVAALVAGVFSLEDALSLVLFRGRLISKLSGGAMLSVPLSRENIQSFLTDKLSIAVDNGTSCIVAGEEEEVNALEQHLKKEKQLSMRLTVSHAVHSTMMDPILEEFEGFVGRLNLKEPGIPFISNVTGNRIKEDEAVSPAYWTRHLRQTVRFADGIKELIKESSSIFVEIGPGRDLVTMVKKYIDHNSGHQILNLVRNPQKEVSDVYYILNQMGRIWLYGNSLDWHNFYAQEKRRRVPLPLYPFEGRSYWIDKETLHNINMKLLKNPYRRKPEIADWFYVPLWEQSILNDSNVLDKRIPLNWLVLADDFELGLSLADQLKYNAQNVVYVKKGNEFIKKNEREFEVNPSRESDYGALFKALCLSSYIPNKILHFWSISKNNENGDILKHFERSQETGFNSLLYLVRALGRQGINSEIHMIIFTNNMAQVFGDEWISPEKATILGGVKVIPLEYRHLKCRCVDFPMSARVDTHDENLIDLLLHESISENDDFFVAIRGNRRWMQSFKPICLDRTCMSKYLLRTEGVYLITGGMGGIGFSLAEFLARVLKANVILTGRSQFPVREDWDKWLETHDYEDHLSVRIRKVRELEALGASIIIVSVDVTDLQMMQKTVDQIRLRFGTINGVIHSAGVIDYAGVIQRRNNSMTEDSMAARVKGALVLDTILKDTKLDFFVFFSSLGNILYKDRFGQVGYVAGNEFLEAFTDFKNSQNGTYTITINWCDWLDVGMVMKALDNQCNGDQKRIEANIRELSVYAISPSQGAEIFSRIMESPFPHLIISPQDLPEMIEQMNIRQNDSLDSAWMMSEMKPPETLYERPELSTKYAAPRNKIEQKLVDIFQRFFGIDQVGIYDDFFELGGNSLIAITVISIIHKELNVEVPLVEIFNKPTIWNLAEYIEGAEAVMYSSIQSVEEKNFYVLSSGQKRIYIMQQMERNSTSYNQPHMVLLKGDLDTHKLEESAKKVIERHEILRTTFKMVDDIPAQKVHEAVEVPFKLEYYEYGEGEAEIVSSNFVRPFDLNRLTLFRIALLKFSSRKHVLMLDFHHTISDGVSNNIFIKELSEFYNGKEPIPLRLQYKDFAEWHNNLVSSGDIDKQREYWLHVFEGEIPVLNLPVDYQRPEIKSFEGKIVSFEVESDVAMELKKISQREGATLFIVLLALWNILFSKITGQNDIIIGTPVSGRRHADLNDLMGMFVNTLALRNHPSGDKTFIEFLREVRRNTLKAFENQDFQFEELVDAVVFRRDLSRNPIFDILFVLQNIQNPSIGDNSKGDHAAALSIEPYKFETKSAMFELRIQAVESGEKILIDIEYSTKLFKREKIEWFIRYFKDIASSVLADNGKKLNEIHILYEDERREILSHFRDDLRMEL